MSEFTITYSDNAKGWTSFWSYAPDWMIDMNSSFYTWKNGSLYKHNTNELRSNFYGVQYNSEISLIFNQYKDDVKLYKTINIDSNYPWDTTLTTDLSAGTIESSYYAEKEGDWYAYIRGVDGSLDLRSLSTQGVGRLLLTSFPTADRLIFSFNITASLSAGDSVYKVNGSGALELLGTIQSYTRTEIVLSAPMSPIPSSGDSIVVVKNQQAESHGMRGYFMQVDLTNSQTDKVEIFSVSSNLFKSYM